MNRIRSFRTALTLSVALAAASIMSGLGRASKFNADWGFLTHLRDVGRASADDITPELYLYSVLQDHLMYDDMKQVVAEMQKRQPANPDVAAMADYVKVKTEK
mgnify:CR=1 FL=1